MKGFELDSLTSWARARTTWLFDDQRAATTALFRSFKTMALMPALITHTCNRGPLPPLLETEAAGLRDGGKHREQSRKPADGASKTPRLVAEKGRAHMAGRGGAQGNINLTSGQVVNLA